MLKYFNSLFDSKQPSLFEQIDNKLTIKEQKKQLVNEKLRQELQNLESMLNNEFGTKGYVESEINFVKQKVRPIFISKDSDKFEQDFEDKEKEKLNFFVNFKFSSLCIFELMEAVKNDDGSIGYRQVNSNSELHDLTNIVQYIKKSITSKVSVSG
jgi:hypothetical protein